MFDASNTFVHSWGRLLMYLPTSPASKSKVWVGNNSSWTNLDFKNLRTQFHHTQKWKLMHSCTLCLEIFYSFQSTIFFFCSKLEFFWNNFTLRTGHVNDIKNYVPPWKRVLLRYELLEYSKYFRLNLIELPFKI